MKAQDTCSYVFISLLRRKARKSFHTMIINLLSESCFSNFWFSKEVKNTYGDLTWNFRITVIRKNVILPLQERIYSQDTIRSSENFLTLNLLVLYSSLIWLLQESLPLWMKYSLFSTLVAWNSPPDLWKSCPWAEQGRAEATGLSPPLECGSATEPCVNSPIGTITWQGLCLLPAGVSVVMAKDCDRGLPGDEKHFICILAVKEGRQAASLLPSIIAQKGPASPIWMVQDIPGTRNAGNQICGQEPPVLIPWKWKTSCFDHLGDQPPLLLKANPTLAGTASPPRRSLLPRLRLKYQANQFDLTDFNYIN